MTAAQVQQSSKFSPPAYQNGSGAIAPTKKREEEEEEKEEEIDYSVTDKLIEDRDYYDNASAAAPIVSKDGNFEFSLMDTIKRPDVLCPSVMFESCIFARSNRALLRTPEEDPANVGESWGDYINCTSIGYSLMAAFTYSIGNIVWRTRRRNTIRRRYQIEGNCFKDCAATTFCSPCALAQEDHEIKAREQEIYASDFKQGQQQLAFENMV